MPFEFVCPFCLKRTKVSDEYLGQGGPCANCGRHVVMPTRDASGNLVASIQTGVPVPAKEKLDTRTYPKHLKFAMLLSVLTLMVFAGVIVGIFAVPWFRNTIAESSQRRDLDNMRQIAEALNAYCARYGTYPTPAVTDANGVKLYSWRVLILPFLGYEAEYELFQKDQAWDSPANVSLIRRMPSVFASDNSGDALANFESNYSLIVGSGTLFPPQGPLGKADAKDRPTILIVETRNGGTAWTQPGDIDISQYGLKVADKPMQSIGGLHRDVLLAVDSDENDLRLPISTPQSVLDALVTPNGGESIQPGAWNSGGTTRKSSSGE